MLVLKIMILTNAEQLALLKEIPSCKPVVMTATPYINSQVEMIGVTNMIAPGVEKKKSLKKPRTSHTVKDRQQHSRYSR